MQDFLVPYNITYYTASTETFSCLFVALKPILICFKFIFTIANVRQLTCNRMTGETVLHKAARLGYDDVVLIKIKEGADVNARDNAGWTALHEACSRGMTDVVRVLLKYGADPNSCSESGIRYEST